MNEFLRAFEKFIMRDLAYVVGGAVIILGFLHAFARLPDASTPDVYYFLGAGLAYVIGYATQDVLVLAHVIRMKAGHAPNRFGAWLFRRYDRKEPKFNVEEYEDGKHWLYTCAPRRYQDDHERTESLKQVGFTVGPCLVVAAGLLFARPLLVRCSFECAAAVGALVVGMVLISLGWLKVTQQAQYVIDKYAAARQTAAAEAARIAERAGAAASEICPSAAERRHWTP